MILSWNKWRCMTKGNFMWWSGPVHGGNRGRRFYIMQSGGAIG